MKSANYKKLCKRCKAIVRKENTEYKRSKILKKNIKEEGVEVNNTDRFYPKR